MSPKIQVDRKPEDSNFCYYPFFGLIMTADGKFKVCSKHGEHITDGGECVTVENGNLDRAWNSDYMKQLREDFNNNVQANGCRECWRMQEMGLREMRYDSYDYPIPESQVLNPELPMRVEINASNVCNLSCRICMPTASHKWIKEAKEIYGWEETVHFNMTPSNTEAVRKWVPNLIEIGFFGGEPLSAEENIDLMKYCVETGHSKHITIMVNTNGTVCSDEIIDLFRQFKHVYLNFSIDDIGARFEYQRKGAKWDKVVANMKRYIAAGGYRSEDTIESKICCSVNNMNIYYFPEFFKYMNEHFPGLKVFWNLIYEPWEYSIEILPDDIKDIIRNRLQNFVSATYEMSESSTKTIQDLVTFLDNRIDRDFRKFFTKIEWHDRYRGESFSETFPEYWSLIKKYAPEKIPDINNIMSKDSFAEDSIFVKLLHSAEEEFGKNGRLSESLKSANTLDLFEQLMNIFKASVDHYAFDRDEEKEKHEMLRRLFMNAEFDKQRFVYDVVAHGIKRMVHMINQNSEKDFYGIIADAYMSGYRSASAQT